MKLLKKKKGDETIIEFTSFLDDKTDEEQQIIDPTLKLILIMVTLEFFNTIDSWKLRGENFYMSLKMKQLIQFILI